MSILTTEPSSMDVNLWDEMLALHNNFKEIDNGKIVITNTCPYCNNEVKPLAVIRHEDGTNCFACVDGRHQLLCLVNGQTFQTICEPIKYCPKCGRSLEH